MCRLRFVLAVVLVSALLPAPALPFYSRLPCSPYGISCVGRRSLRLCRRENDFGPAFVCPRGYKCTARSLDVCERVAGDAAELCLRPGRVHDPTEPGCTAYVLCIRHGVDFITERFLCPPGTLFNSETRTCTPLGSYRCPHPDAVPSTSTPREDEKERELKCGNIRELFRGARRAALHGRGEPDGRRQHMGYSCPPRDPARPSAKVFCTVYSDLFCIVLERDENDHISLKLAASLDSVHARTRTTMINISASAPHTHVPITHTHTPIPHTQTPILYTHTATQYTHPSITHTHSPTPHTTHLQTQTRYSLTENTLIPNQGPVRTLFLTI